MAWHYESSSERKLGPSPKDLRQKLARNCQRRVILRRSVRAVATAVGGWCPVAVGVVARFVYGPVGIGVVGKERTVQALSPGRKVKEHTYGIVFEERRQRRELQRAPARVSNITVDGPVLARPVRVFERLRDF